MNKEAIKIIEGMVFEIQTEIDSRGGGSVGYDKLALKREALRTILADVKDADRMLSEVTVIEIDWVNEISLRKNRRGEWRGYELANAIGCRVAKTEAFPSALEAYRTLRGGEQG